MAATGNPLNIRVGADLTEFRKNMAEMKAQLETTKSAMVSMTNAFDGSKFMANANAAVKIVADLGGVTKLTAVEQQKLNTILQQGLQVYAARGTQAPAALAAMAKEAKAATVEMSSLVGAFEAGNGGAAALGSRLAVLADAQLGRAASAMGMTKAEAVGLAAGFGVVVGAGVLLGKALLDAAETTVKIGGTIHDVSLMTGIGVERVSQYRYAMGVMGKDVTAATGAIFQLQRRMSTDTPEFERGLKAIGLTLEGLKRVGGDDQLLMISDAMRAAGDQTRVAEAAFALFGRSGREQLTTLLEPLRELVAESDRLGMTWSERDVAAAHELEENLNRMKLVAEGLKVAIGGDLVGAFTTLYETEQKYGTWSLIRLLTAASFAPNPFDSANFIAQYGKAREQALREFAMQPNLNAVGAPGITTGPQLDLHLLTDDEKAAKVATDYLAESQATLSASVRAAALAIFGGGGSATDALKRLKDEGLTPSDLAVNALYTSWKKGDEAAKKWAESEAQWTAVTVGLTDAQKDQVNAGLLVTSNLDLIARHFQLPADAVREYKADLDKAKASQDWYTKSLAEMAAGMTAIPKEAIEWGASLERRSENEARAMREHDKIQAEVLEGIAEFNARRDELGKTGLALERLQLDAEQAQVERQLRQRYAAETVLLEQLLQAEREYYNRRRAIIESETYKVGSALGDAGGFLSQLQGPMGELGRMMTTIGDGMKQMAEVGVTSAKGIATAFAAAASVVQQAWGGSKAGSVISGTLGGISAGMSIGSEIMPGIGTAIGGLIGGVGGFLSGIFGGGPSEEEIAAQKANEQIKQYWENLKKTYGSLIQIDAIGKAIGVDLAGSWPVSGVGGQALIEKLSTEFAEAEAKVLASMEKGTGLANQQVIALMRAYELSSATADQQQKASEYYQAQLKTAAGGLTALLAGMQASADAAAQKTFIDLQLAAGSTLKAAQDAAKEITGVFLHSQAQADGLAQSIIATFGEMLVRGVSFKDALAAIQQPVTVLSQELDQTGIRGGAAFEYLSQMSAIANDAIMGPLASAIIGAKDSLVGLHNEGLLTQTMFSGITETATQAYQQIIAQGGDGTAALGIMQPELQAIWQLQKFFGFSVDETTQALLDQAVASRLVGDGVLTDEQKQLAALTSIADKMGELVEYFEKIFPAAVNAGFTAAGAAAAGFVDQLVMPAITLPRPGTPGRAVPEFATGTDGYEWFGSGTPAVLHGWEAVVPLHRADGGSGGATSRAAAPIGPAPAPVTNIFNFDIRALDRAGVRDDLIKVVIPGLAEVLRRGGQPRTEILEGLGLRS